MSSSDSIHMVNGFDPRRGAPVLDAGSQALLTRRDAVLGAAYRLFYERPVQISRGAGAHLFDVEGADYLDAYNNVPVVGHSNERVREAVSAQLAVVNTHTRYLTTPVVDYAERLVGLFPAHLDQVIFACSGSESVDLALRIARHVTGREGVIATRHAYHGTTQAAATVSPSLGVNNPIPPEVALIDGPDAVRDPAGGTGALFLERVRDAIDELRSRGVPVAALIVDTVFSSDGLQLDDAGYLAAAAELVREAGGLFIADEVQGGFGRLGTHWWGFQRHDAEPDLVVLGKPMGNGLPVSAVIGRSQIFDAFGRDVRYFNTFAGSPVAMVAAAAVLDELQQRALLPHAEAIGAGVRSALEQLAAGDPGIASVRGSGLFLGVEFVTDPDSLSPDAARANRVVNSLREQRVLVSASGTYDNVLKIRPPLVFDDADAARLLDAMTVAFTL